MSIKDKFKNLINISEEEFLDDVDDIEEDDEEDTSRDVRSNFSFNHRNERDGKVLDIRSGVPSDNAGTRAKVVLKRIDSLDDVTSVADIINEKKIALLNLETCERETAVRILDFLSGVAYANRTEIQRTASRAYIIVPHNVSISGENLDEAENSNY